MRKTVVVLSALFLLAAATYAQSGRHKDPAGKSPVVLPPVETPSPDAANPSKPPLPREVDGERIYTTKELDEKPEILKKPNPRYPKDARRHLTRGIVVLRVILASDATVKHIEIETGLPDGLSESSIEAARQIKFKPGVKDGKPVSVWVGLEYHFDIY